MEIVIPVLYLQLVKFSVKFTRYNLRVLYCHGRQVGIINVRELKSRNGQGVSESMTYIPESTGRFLLLRQTDTD
jgi:hypothetical protein